MSMTATRIEALRDETKESRMKKAVTRSATSMTVVLAALIAVPAAILGQDAVPNMESIAKSISNKIFIDALMFIFYYYLP